MVTVHEGVHQSPKEGGYVTWRASTVSARWLLTTLGPVTLAAATTRPALSP